MHQRPAHSLISRPLSRRRLLRGLGAALPLPLLEAMLPRRAHASSTFKPWANSGLNVPRVIFCYVPNGKNVMQWLPKQRGRDYQLSPTLEPLKNHRQDFTVLSGLGHPGAKGGHSGADTWLTGAYLQGTPGSDYTNSLSVDQLIAEVHGPKTRFPSLQLSAESGTGRPGHSHTLSFDRSGTPIPSANSPNHLFARLFVPDVAAERAAALRQYAERRSILDSVMGEARRLNTALGKGDQQKLDEYLTSVRATEARIKRQEAWVDVPKAKVDAGTLFLSAKPGNSHDRALWLGVTLELSYLAFVTDTTRVITFEWSREAGGFGPGGENHHALSHHGGDEGMLRSLGEIDRFHVSQLVHFVELCKATREGDGTVLDRTIVLYGSGMNSGDRGEHSPADLPLLIAGGHKLGLKHGQHLAFDVKKHPPLSNLLLTVAQKMGVKATRFSDSTGTLPGLV